MIDENLFRQAMGRFASGVTVVTAAHAGRRTGITVSSFASLSLQPTLLLICIDRAAASHDMIAAAGRFAVSVLAEDQADLSQLFASDDPDKFRGVALAPSPGGLPLLAGAVAHLECALHSSLPGGDHTIFVGEALRAAVFERPPLLYFRSAYGRLGE
jgi:flavin reductase (DIM6/NTAB) family NADH-FMN oxidoreductase RutF